MDLLRLIRARLRDALDDGGTSGAVAANTGGSGHTTVVTSDGDATIIERDGERQVINHRPPSSDDADE